MDRFIFRELMEQYSRSDRYVKYLSGKIIGPIRKYEIDKAGVVLFWYVDNVENIAYVPYRYIREVGAIVPPVPNFSQSSIWFWERD